MEPEPFRLRNFRFAFFLTICTAGWIATIYWILADSQFHSTLWFLKIRLRLESMDVDPAFVRAGLLDGLLEHVSSYDALGPRIWGLSLLWGISLFAAVFTAIVLFEGYRSRCRRNLRIAAFCGLAIAWIGLWWFYPSVREQAIVWRAQQQLPDLKRALGAVQPWPNKHGSIPVVGEFYTYPDKSPKLILPSGKSGYLTSETILRIEQSYDNRTRFYLGSNPEYQIEHHPVGSVPVVCIDTFGNALLVERVIPLQGEWFLVKYQTGDD